GDVMLSDGTGCACAPTENCHCPSVLSPSEATASHLTVYTPPVILAVFRLTKSVLPSRSLGSDCKSLLSTWLLPASNTCRCACFASTASVKTQRTSLGSCALVDPSAGVQWSMKACADASAAAASSDAITHRKANANERFIHPPNDADCAVGRVRLS